MDHNEARSIVVVIWVWDRMEIDGQMKDPSVFRNLQNKVKIQQENKL